MTKDGIETEDIKISVCLNCKVQFDGEADFCSDDCERAYDKANPGEHPDAEVR